MKTQFYSKTSTAIWMVAIILPFLMSCSTTGNVTVSSSTLSSTVTSDLVISEPANKVFFGSITYPDNMSILDQEDIHWAFKREKTLQIAYSKLVHTAQGIQDWRGIHSEAQRLIESSRDGQFELIISQLVSANILRHFFVNAEVNPEMQKAAEYYLDILVKYNAFKEKRIFAKMLPKMKGFWANQKISDIASHCLESKQSLNELQRIDKQTMEQILVRQAQHLAIQSPEKLDNSTPQAWAAKMMVEMEKAKANMQAKQPMTLNTANNTAKQGIYSPLSIPEEKVFGDKLVASDADIQILQKLVNR